MKIAVVDDVPRDAQLLVQFLNRFQVEQRVGGISAPGVHHPSTGLTDEEMAQINALDRNEEHDWY